jgi:tyrosyl-tRNA synthetase
MGKTAQGAIWLNAEKLSPYQYWQFWRNTDDADVGRFLRLFTELDLTLIAQLEGGQVNEAKKALATEATALCHGREAAEAAAEMARAVFEGVGATTAVGDLSVKLQPLKGVAVTAAAASFAQAELLTSITRAIPRELLERGIPAFELFSRAGLAASNGEARRLIRGGGARINDRVVENETKAVSLADLDPQGLLKLSAGRKRHALIRPV